MGKRIKQDNELIPIDNSANELFGDLEKDDGNKQLQLSFIPSFFTTASLPFKNINKRFASSFESLMPFSIIYSNEMRLLVFLL